MKVLIISRTFFPDPLVSAIRVTEWAKYMRDQGDEVTVVCRHYNSPNDGDLLPQLPGIKVVRMGRPPSKLPVGVMANGALPDGVDASTVEKIKSKFRVLKTIGARQVSIPDVSIWSHRAMLDQTLELARTGSPDVVISSSPPHSIHWLARSVAGKVNVPWVADFRDPFTVDKRFRRTMANPFARYLLHRFERAIYNDARIITHAIPIHERFARMKYPLCRSKIKLLTNGIPDSLVKAVDATPPVDLAQKENLKVFSSSNLSWSVIRTICSALSLAFTESEIELRFCGNRPSGLEEKFSGVSICYLGRVPHSEAVLETSQADLLISHLPKHQSEGLGLSSKLFEYLSVSRPVIHLNPTRPDRAFLKSWPQAITLENPTEQELREAFTASIELPADALMSDSSKFRKKYSRHDQCCKFRSWLVNALS